MRETEKVMLNLGINLVAAFFGTVSFAVIFEAPTKYYLHCGVIGAFGWLIYLLVVNRIGVPFATFIASLTLIWLSRETAYMVQAPVTIFLICGIFCLVPGIGIYNFTYNFFIGDSMKAAQIGIAVLKVAIAIALGISLGYELPAKFFLGYRRRAK